MDNILYVIGTTLITNLILWLATKTWPYAKHLVSEPTENKAAIAVMNQVGHLYRKRARKSGYGASASSTEAHGYPKYRLLGATIKCLKFRIKGMIENLHLRKENFVLRWNPYKER
jgi:hypothetical protein